MTILKLANEDGSFDVGSYSVTSIVTDYRQMS